MGWGSVARDNVQVEGVELILCVNGCVTSLGTGPAYATIIVRMRNRKYDHFVFGFETDV